MAAYVAILELPAPAAPALVPPPSPIVNTPAMGDVPQALPENLADPQPQTPTDRLPDVLPEPG